MPNLSREKERVSVHRITTDTLPMDQMERVTLSVDIFAENHDQELPIVPTNYYWYNNNTLPLEELEIVQTNYYWCNNNTLSAEIDVEAAQINVTTRPERTYDPAILLNTFYRYFLFGFNWFISRVYKVSPILLLSGTAVASKIYLLWGLEMLETTGLSASITPRLAAFFRYSFAIAVCHLSTCGLMFPHRRPLSDHIRYLGVALSVVPIVHLSNDIFSASLYTLIVSFSTAFDRKPLHFDIWIYVYWFSQYTFFHWDKGNVSPDLVMVISIFTAGIWTALSDHFPSLYLGFVQDIYVELLPVAASRVKELFCTAKAKQITRFITFAARLWATLLFQNYFRLTTPDHVMTFFCLAMSWLSSLILSGASHDCGFLNFLLGNMIVGSTVGRSGLGTATWLAYGACLHLFLLRQTLNSTDLLHDRPSVVSLVFYLTGFFLPDFLRYI